MKIQTRAIIEGQNHIEGRNPEKLKWIQGIAGRAERPKRTPQIMLMEKTKIKPKFIAVLVCKNRRD